MLSTSHRDRLGEISAAEWQNTEMVGEVVRKITG
jgi:hypothetical protein